jgi:hypothetical protein
MEISDIKSNVYKTTMFTNEKKSSGRCLVIVIRYLRCSNGTLRKALAYICEAKPANAPTNVAEDVNSIFRF